MTHTVTQDAICQVSQQLICHQVREGKLLPQHQDAQATLKTAYIYIY